LSHLSLDLDAPVGGWDAALKTMGVDVLTDDIGRKAIRRDDARQLFTERADAEQWQREAVERHDAELEELRRAQLRGGVSADMVPAGVLPATAMLQAVRDAQPRRRTPLEEALGGGGLVYHPIERDDESWAPPRTSSGPSTGPSSGRKRPRSPNANSSGRWTTAAYLAAPRVRLVDQQRRIVRVVNAPVEARRHPPPTLRHWWTDTMYRHGFELVGRFHGRPTPRDIDYVVPRTAPGEDFLTILRDEVEPTVVVRRYSNGDNDLLTSFQM
jgi:hypothetical protein